MVYRIILDQSKKKLGFDDLNYLVSPEKFVTDYDGLNIPLYNQDKSKYWISLEELSNKFISNNYYNKTKSEDLFIKKTDISIDLDDEFDYDVVLLNDEKESFKISLSELNKLRNYKTIDNTTDDLSSKEPGVYKAEKSGNYAGVVVKEGYYTLLRKLDDGAWILHNEVKIPQNLLEGKIQLGDKDSSLTGDTLIKYVQNKLIALYDSNFAESVGYDTDAIVAFQDGIYKSKINENKYIPINTLFWEKLYDIQIGGRNLFLNSKNERTYSNTDPLSVGTFETNTEYTISFDAKIVSGNPLFHVEFNGGIKAKDFELTTNYVRYSHTLNSDNVNGHLYFWLTSAGEVALKNIKVEKGNKATDWTPALEDLTVDIEKSKQESIIASKAYSDLQDNLKEIQIKAYADGIVTEEEQRAIQDATAKAEAARMYAEAQDNLLKIQVEAYADGQITAEEQARIQQAKDNLAAAKAYSEAQDELKRIQTEAYADGIVTEAEQRSIADATAKAEAAKLYAIAQDNLLKTQVQAYADGIITAEEQARIKQAQDNLAAAKAYSDSQDELKRIQTEAYADGIVTAAEQRAIDDATAKADAAKLYAEAQDNLLRAQLEAYADGKISLEEQQLIQQMQDNLAAAKAYADAQANLAKIAANAYADGVIDEEEARAIADATAKMEAAKAHAQGLVNNIQIGGRNLLKGTSSEWKTLVIPSTEYFINFGSDIKIEHDTEYTFAIEVEKVSNDSAPINLHLGLGSTAGTYTWDFPTWKIDNIEMGKKIVLTHKVLPTDGTGNHAFFAFRLRNEQLSTTIRYRFVKLEKGNKATDWTPAPEDVEAEIQKSKLESVEAAKLYTEAQDNLLKTQVQAYADGIVTSEEQARIQQAQNNLAAAKAYSDAQDELSKTLIKAYADGKITEEEARAIADATTKMEAAKAHAQGLVNNIQIGGRNLILNSANIHMRGNDHQGSDNSVKGQITINSTGNWNCYDWITLSDIDKKGKTLTSSIEIWTSNPITLNFGTHFSYEESVSVDEKFIEAGKWVKFLSTYENVGTNNTLIGLNGQGAPIGTIIKYRKAKIEIGNKATDWTPAPEDVEAEIQKSKLESVEASKLYTEAQDNLLRVQVQAYADGIVTEEEAERIRQMQDNLAAAKAYSDAQDELSKTLIKAYADGKITEEEARAIADATAKMELAKQHAQSLVNNIQIGGRNLYKKNTVLDTDGTLTRTETGFTIIGKSSGNSRIRIKYVIQEDGKYTFSGYVKNVFGENLTFKAADFSSPYQTFTFIGDGQRKRFEMVFSVSGSSVTSNFIDIDYIANSQYIFEDIKIEKGNKATGWTPAPEDVEAEIQKSKLESVEASKLYTEAQDNLLRVQVQAYTDGVVTSEEQARIQQAQNNLAAAKAYSDAQDELSKILIKAYADGIVDEEEARSIADATAKMEAAKAHAQSLVNNIQIGGRNLILTSQKYNYDSSIWYTPNSSIIIPSGNGMIVGNSVLITPQFSVEFIDGEQYVISFDYLSLTPSKIIYNGSFRDITEGNSKKIRISFPFVFNKNENKTTIYFQNPMQGTSCTISNIKLEKGNKATDWTPAPEDVDNAINDVKIKAEQAISQLTLIANDNILSPSEKQQVYNEWNRIKSEYTSNYGLATNNGISTTNYTNSYNDLYNYITPLLVNISVDSPIVGDIFRAKFKAYYDQNIALIVAINEKLRSGINANSGAINRINQVTSFLNTTVNGNVIGTGVLMVGSEAQSNAGISGLNEAGSKSVRLWAGGTAQNRDKAAWNTLDDGTMQFFHPNGQIAFRFGLSNGKFIMDGYHENGQKLWELSPNRGLVNVAYIPESWNNTPMININQSSSILDENTAKNLLNSLVLEDFKYPSQVGEDGFYRWYFNNNYTCFEYQNGTHPDYLQYSNLVGYKSQNDSRTANIPNGWYGLQIGILISTFGEYPPPRPTVNYMLYYVENGKVIKTKNINF